MRTQSIHADQYADLRNALALRPTRGIRAVHPVKAQVDILPSGEPLCALLWPTEIRSEDETIAKASLIAATDPETIERLLEERDSLIAKVDALRKIIDEAQP